MAEIANIKGRYLNTITVTIELRNPTPERAAEIIKFSQSIAELHDKQFNDINLLIHLKQLYS